jgi:beta-lactamase regulating signal transducer with metallopeptidase domain
MNISADILDYVWKSIVVISIISTVIMSISLVAWYFSKNKLANSQLKLFFNLHSALLLLSIGFVLIVLIHADPELESACFSHFAKHSSSINITRLLSGVYFFIVLAMLGFDFFKTLIAYRKIQSLKKVGPDGTAILTGLIEKLKLKSTTSLYVSSETQSPFAWGLFNHRIVVTESLLKADCKEKLQAILSHEAIHVKDHDSIWILMSHLSKRILFFHPLAYLFSSKHHIVTEMTADELAIHKCGVQKSQLMTALIEIAEQCRERNGVLMQAHASRGFCELSARILAMTDDRRQKMNWLFPFIATVSLASCCLVAVVQARASIESSNKLNGASELVCSQVKHEKIIEVWLSIQALPIKNKCELN